MSFICFVLLSNPVISFTWHPHGRHYMNICELHLEAFLHVKCLAVSLLQGKGPFAVTNQVSLLHLHPDTTKRRVQPQTANVGKSLCCKCMTSSTALDNYIWHRSSRENIWKYSYVQRVRGVKCYTASSHIELLLRSYKWHLIESFVKYILCAV